jgi:protein-S-isoprenylcysteine O-methyltransferase Ste14
MMNSPGSAKPAEDHKPGIIRWIIVSIIFLILMAASLFLSAGTLDWTAAWMYVILAGLILLLDALVLIPISPELLGLRSRPQAGAKKWDQLLSRLMATIGPLTSWIISGLDYRYAWLPEFPGWLVIIATIFVFGGGLLALWAMAANRFFIGMVRIQDERGHLVIKSGPYQYLRHPGYLGSLFYILFTPLVLASLWGLIPALLICGVIFLRTSLEDQVLKDELPGYQDYSLKVTTKLIPGIW